MKKVFSVLIFLAAWWRVAAAPPNIVFILTDDLGYGDLSCFGQRRFTTPALDRLAAEGAKLTHHYSAAPVCAPSRASLMLGMSQGHAAIRDNQFDKALEDNHTLASVLRRAGYATTIIGKWGLHGQPVMSEGGADPWAIAHPLNRGFDSFYGMLRHIDGHEHYPKEAPYFVEKAKRRGAVTVWADRVDVTAELDRCYTADLFTARAKKFIVDHTRTSPAQPFFLFLSHDTPHGVLELPTQPYPAGGGLKGGVQWLGQPGHLINTANGEIDSWIDPAVSTASYDHDGNAATPEVPWPDVYRRHATSVKRIDAGVADLMQLLRDLRIDENTIVIFSSDNGPSDEAMIPGVKFTPEFFASYGPFDGIKRDLWEGGLRVPTLVRWPAQIAAGQTLSEPSAQWDWLATLVDAAGWPVPARVDGVSLLPALKGKRSAEARDALYFEYRFEGRTPGYADFDATRRDRPRRDMQAVRAGDLMAVRYDVKSPEDAFEVYDVTQDPGEQRNLAKESGAAAMQERFRALAQQHRRSEPSAVRPYDEALVPGAPVTETTPGLSAKYYSGSFPWVPAFAAMKPQAVRTVTTIDAGEEGGREAGGILFEGFIQAPEDGEYTFHLSTDTGAVLRLHGALLIDADYGYTSGTEISARIRLRAGAHPLRLAVIHREAGASSLAVDWSGPGFSRQPIPATALTHTKR